jgi:hypothetical protein
MHEDAYVTAINGTVTEGAVTGWGGSRGTKFKNFSMLSNSETIFVPFGLCFRFNAALFSIHSYISSSSPSSL